MLSNLEGIEKLTDVQAAAIIKNISRKVNELCYGRESNAYSNTALREKIYSYVWKKLKDYFNVSVYRNILRKDYSRALKYIDSIALDDALLKEVCKLNSCWERPEIQ